MNRSSGRPHSILNVHYITFFSYTPADMGRVNVSGKPWKGEKTPIPPPVHTSWDRKQRERQALELVKAKEREMKGEKEAARQQKIDRIKQRREAQAEKERYEKMAEKMHRKRVERVKRREKRNKLLKER